MRVIIHLARLVECVTPGMNPKVNCGLWAVMMCQRRFISDSKCATLGVDVINGGGYACLRAGGRMGVSLHLFLGFAEHLELP